MSARAIVGIILFMSFLIYLTAQFAILDAGSDPVVNVTGNNQTQILSGDPRQIGGFSGDVCSLAGSENTFINLLQSFVNAVPLANCVIGFGAYLISYQSITTGVVWLGLIIFACIAALVYLGTGLLRGGK